MKQIFLFTLLIVSCTCFAKRIYVNPLATDTSDGTSWARAYKNLQYGLDDVQTGDTVLVAAGIYKNPGFSSHYYYRIFREGITVLGGYPNSGNPSDAQRNWANNPTILSGEIINYGYADNVFLVQNIADPVVIDGFVIKNSQSVGLRIENSPSVVIKNTLFENNVSQSINIANSSATFVNCVIFNNQSSGIYNNTNATTSLYNCVVANNTGYAGFLKNENASLAIYNCTLVNNTGAVVAGTGTGKTVIKNSIFWGNSNGGRFEDADIQSENQTFDVSHCITQTWYSDNIKTLLVNHHPRFLNQLQPAGADNKFFTADDGLQLTVPCSPALNYGDNSLLGSITGDMIGNPRIFNGGIVDLGAYEMQEAPGAHFKTVYVNNSAGTTGTPDGSSWTTAFTTLQQALLYCADTIKIAAGTYLTANSAVDSVFSLESGKVILGGYPASGNPSDAGRDPWTYQTILKGNYPGGESANGAAVIKSYHNDSTTILDGLQFTNWSTSSGSNAYAVKVGYGSKLKIMNCDFRIDAAKGIRASGLFIQGASRPSIYRCAFNTGNYEYGGVAVLCIQNSQAFFGWCSFQGYLGYRNDATVALAVENSSATLDSCVFNKETDQANAIFVRSLSAVLTINNCFFRSKDGGAPQLQSAGNTTGQVSNSIFRNILTDKDIPAVYNDNSHLTFTKCLFDSCRLTMRNRNLSAPVLNNCLSVHGRFMWNQRSFPLVNNCTVVNTYFIPQAIDVLAREELVINEDSSVFRANNTIFWSAKLNAGKKDIFDREYSAMPQTNSRSILMNCLTQNYGIHGQNGNIVGKVPRFNRLDQINGPDSTLFTADDGLQLAPCSPAVNAGNSAIGDILTTDVLDLSRIAQGTLDIGAYELQQPANSTGAYYVNEAANGNNTGTSWNDAYSDLQTALCNACADTIRVAEGTYKPAVKSKDSAFVINRPLAMYGGYPASGNPGYSDRDVIKYPTILSGNLGNPDSLGNTGLIVFVNAVTDSVYIDGFEIRDGFNSGTLAGNALGAAGLGVLYTNTGIYNCRFINNHAFPFGGGLSISSGSICTVSRCIFTDNSAGLYGGALYSSGYLRLTNSVFENNNAYGKGGAVCAVAGSNISNSVFYRNYTTSTSVEGVGGGLYVAGGVGKINNCSFVENKATYTLENAGGGLYSDEALGIITKNSVFSGNTAGSSTTTKGADIDWSGNYSTLFNCILQYERPYPLPAMRNIITEPGFEAVDNPKGADNIWLTADDGLQLHHASAAINHGQNEAVADLPFDILGDDRIVLDTVDAGAYEYQNRPVAHAGADTTICTGTSVKIGREGNPEHIYSWTSSPAGFTSASATPVVSPVAPATYFLEVSNGNTIARDTIEVSVSGSLSPAVTAVTASTSVCAGTATIFKAIPVYGGDDASYQWLLNGVNAGTDAAIFSAVMQEGDQVSVRLTSSISCASTATAISNVVTMHVTPSVVPEVTVDGPVTFCAGDTVTYTATPFNGGTNPIYKWWKGGLLKATTYNNTYTTAISSQSEISVMMISNAVCQTKAGDTSNKLTVLPKLTITPYVYIEASNSTICGMQPATFKAQGAGTGTNPSWQWKINNNNAGSNSNVFTSSALKTGDKVVVVMTSNAECARPPVVESNPVTVSVTPLINPAINITASKTEVTKDSSVTITANLVNGYGTASYTWQDSTATHNWQTVPNAVSHMMYYSPGNTGDKIRCVAQTATNCGDIVTLQSAPVAFKVNTVTGIDPVPAGNYGITSWPNPVNTFMVIDGLRLSDQWQSLEISSVEGRHKILVQNIAGQTQVRPGIVQLNAGLYIAILRKKNGEMVYLKFLKL